MTLRSTRRYVGFTDVPPMPMARSDMSVTLYTTPDPDNARLYLMGGCVRQPSPFAPSIAKIPPIQAHSHRRRARAPI